MTFSTLILIVLVAALAGYAGYMMGRASAANERRFAQPSPLPAPIEPQDNEPEPPRQPRGIPPAASAGTVTQGSSNGTPRRTADGVVPAGSTASAAPKRGVPPPAAAGLAALSGGKPKRD